MTRNLFEQRTSSACAVLAVLATVALAAPAGAQVGDTGEALSVEARGGALLQPQYYLEPGLEEELKIKVRVWGEVNVPGLYIVADGIDVMEVLSLAGGPTEDANLSDVRVIRALADETEVLEVDVEDYVESGSVEAIVLLEPGDTVMVPSQTWPRVFRWTGLVSTLALIANVIVNASQ